MPSSSAKIGVRPTKCIVICPSADPCDRIQELCHRSERERAAALGPGPSGGGLARGGRLLPPLPSSATAETLLPIGTQVATHLRSLPVSFIRETRRQKCPSSDRRLKSVAQEPGSPFQNGGLGQAFSWRAMNSFATSTALSV